MLGRCVCRHRAHHPVGEAGGADAERDVEPSAQVLQRNVVCEFDELHLVEVLAEFLDERVGHLRWCACHGGGVVQDQLLDVGELLAVPVVRQREELFVGEPGVPRDLARQINAPLAVDKGARPQFGEDLKPPVEAMKLRGGLLELAVGAENAREVRVKLEWLEYFDRSSAGDLREGAAGESRHQPHSEAAS